MRKLRPRDTGYLPGDLPGSLRQKQDLVLGLLAPRLVLFQPQPPGMKGQGCAGGERVRDLLPAPHLPWGPERALTLPAPQSPLLPPGCQEASNVEVKNEPLNVL